MRSPILPNSNPSHQSMRHPGLSYARRSLPLRSLHQGLSLRSPAKCSPLMMTATPSPSLPPSITGQLGNHDVVAFLRLAIRDVADTSTFPVVHIRNNQQAFLGCTRANRIERDGRDNGNNQTLDTFQLSVGSCSFVFLYEARSCISSTSGLPRPAL